MSKKLGKDTLEQALTLLAEKLEFDHAEPVSLVVCDDFERNVEGVKP